MLKIVIKNYDIQINLTSIEICVFIILGLPENDQTEWSYFRESLYKAFELGTRKINKWLIDSGVPPLRTDRIYYESEYLNIYNYPKELDYTNLRPLPPKWTQFDAFVRTENESFVIPQQLKDKSGKLIYFSLGTFISVDVEMMKRLIKILEETPHRYIISKG